jgi:YVTN family beta-propeller protein
MGRGASQCEVTMDKLLRMIGRLGGLLILGAMPAAGGTARIYVTNHAGTTISVVDPASNKVVEEIKDIEVPEAVDFARDGSRLYITQGPENVLTVLDRKTQREIKKIPLSGHANDLAVTPDGKWVVVCIGQVPGGLDLIDTTSLENVKTIPAETRLHDVVISADSKFAVTTSPNGKFVRVFDLQRQEFAWEVKFDQGTLVPTIESAPDGSIRRIFVQLAESDGFAVVDFATHRETARIKFPGDEPALARGGSPPSHGIGVSPDNKSLWVSSATYDAVFVYSLPDLKLEGRVRLPQILPPGRDPVSGGPEWVAFTPDNKWAYIANTGDRSVTAIDMNSLKAVARIPVGEAPGRMNTLVLQ